MQWTATGGDPGTGTGETFATKWDSVGVKTVQAVCGSSSSTPKSIQIAVVEIADTIVDGSNPEDTGPIDVIAGTTVALRATRNPPPKDGPFPANFPQWGVTPNTTPDGAYLRIAGPFSGPVIHLTGVIPSGITTIQQFTETATCCDSAQTMQVNLLPACSTIAFVSADNDFNEMQSNTPELIHVAGVKKAAGQKTTLTIALNPDTPANRQKISWEGATVVPGSGNLKATVPVDLSERRIVKVKFDGQPCKEIWVWPIWVDLEVRIVGALSPENNALNLRANLELVPPRPFGWQDAVTWPWPDDIAFLGGGTSLGPIDHYGTANFKHGIAGGRVEIVGTVKPEFVWNNINLSFSMERKTVLQKFWDNGGHCTNPMVDNSDPNDPKRIFCAGDWVPGIPVTFEDEDDNSDPENQDVTPADSGGMIFDTDVPGCPPQFGFSIQHTAEAYINFDQWAEVDLGAGLVKCSDVMPWSYTAQVDGDEKSVIRNTLNTAHIPANDMVSHFDPR